MKRLFTSLFLVLSLASWGQTTTTADRVVARQSLYVKDRWIEKVANDITDMTNERAVMTAKAVADYVQARLSGTITDQMILNWNTAYSWGNHAGLYLQNQSIAAQAFNGWMSGRLAIGTAMFDDGTGAALQVSGNAVFNNTISLKGSTNNNSSISANSSVSGLILSIQYRSTHTSGFTFGSSGTVAPTSGHFAAMRLTKQSSAESFAPTSGTAAYSSILIEPTINQQNPANGTVYGVNYSPFTTAIQGKHYAFYATTGMNHLGNMAADPSGASNGDYYYNNTVNRFRIYEENTWKSITDNQTISGKTILVDKDNPNATDVRGTLSKYNQTYPFKTVNAALSVVAVGDNVRIKDGYYNERVVFPGTFPNSINVVLDNAGVLSWTNANVGFTLSGIGNAYVDTVYYASGALYSGLSKIKVVVGTGQATGFFRNIYSIDSVSAASNALEFYNINNIRTMRAGPMTRVYNSRIVNTNGVAVSLPYNGTTEWGTAFVECYIEGATAFDCFTYPSIKILDSEVYGKSIVFNVRSGAGSVKTPKLRALNTLFRHDAGGNFAIIGQNNDFQVEFSNTTRTSESVSLGTAPASLSYLLRNNDAIYSGL